MSNDVCGFIEPPLSQEVKDALNEYINGLEIGISDIRRDQLYNFPDDMLSMDNSYSFLIGDKKGYPNASYLIDFITYAPEANIGFPNGAKERLEILLDTLVNMFSITNAQKMVVALTECNQIETIKKIKISQLYDVVVADFEEYQAPPDTLYEISR